MRRVVVTGLGIVCPLGVGCRTAWGNLVAARSGVVALSDERYAKLPSRVAGVVPRGAYSEGKWDAQEWVDRTAMRRVPLFGQYAVAAARQALDDAQWAPDTEEQRCATGVAVGSGIGGFDALYDNVVAYEAGGYRKVSPLFVPSLLNNMAAGHISIMNNLKGPNHSASTACTTGAHAIGDAFNFIRLGMADVMVAGSTEAPIHPLAISGFARAKSLSTSYNEDPEQASRPFDKDRSGFVIGEGAAIMVLESLDHAIARGRRIYAEVAGYGLSGDAFHITAPREDGDGAFRSMEAALKSSGVAASEVGYINAHATSTKLGDAAETSAISRLFGRSAAVSSTKGATGHLLGGAGSLEAVFTVLALHHGILPPTLNLQETEPEFEELNYVPLKAQTKQVDYALTNSFGFGGTNASLIFKRHNS